MIKVYGAPVVTRVSEEYPGYMAGVDSKVNAPTLDAPSAAAARELA
jgi:hypothetical protein